MPEETVISDTLTSLLGATWGQVGLASHGAHSSNSQYDVLGEMKSAISVAEGEHQWDKYCLLAK